MLGQAAGYATAALGYLATAGGKPLLVKEIADACAIPGPYLGKIVNTLRRVGLVQTQRGVGGGVTLARHPQEISLYTIAELLKDPICNRRCMLGTAECSEERACPAHRFWSEHREHTLDFLRKTTIADMAAFETRRRTRALQPRDSRASLRIEGKPIDRAE
ncbi:MAG TPA: Rrf2 family transcriptional regulator [Phycisphaerales bacterium]|jgi:Rrf2 family protein|nr:Rrf2 family transcriptional regulator [Phycisphaerales bacterium]